MTKTGPNRRTVSTGVFLLSDEIVHPLGTIGRVDFATLPEAERDVCDVFLWYKSCVRSAHAAPDFRAVLSRIDALRTNMEITGKAIQSFFDLAGDGLSRIEFRAAVSEVLRESGLSRSEMDETIESTTEALSRLDIFFSVLRGGLLEWEASGQVEPVSQRQIRSEYYRRLLRTLGRHGLDQRTGENSLIVQLAMKLDGRALVHRTGDEAAKEAMEDRRRRRDLASDIKAAVKEGNVG